MTTVELITALFYEVDEQLRVIPKHPEAHLWPSEVVTLAAPRPQRRGQIKAFIADCRATIGHCFLGSPSAPGSFVFQNPSGLDAGFSGRPDRTRGIARMALS